MQKSTRTKKLLLWIAVGSLVFLTVGVVTLTFTLDKVVRHAVVSVGSRTTGVDVQLDAVELSLLNGEGALRGFVLGNPEGYTSPSCIEFDEASLSVEPASLLSEKVVVRHLRLVSPEITFEGSVTANNFGDLRKRLSSSEERAKETSPGKETPDDGDGSRRFQINELTLTGARLNVILKELGGQPQALILPDIQLRDLGTGAEGVTSKELGQRILDKILKAALEELARSARDREPVPGAARGSLDASGESELQPTASSGGHGDGRLTPWDGAGRAPVAHAARASGRTTSQYPTSVFGRTESSPTP